jgi:hypothetical protein
MSTSWTCYINFDRFILHRVVGALFKLLDYLIEFVNRHTFFFFFFFFSVLIKKGRRGKQTMGENCGRFLKINYKVII